MVDVETRVCIKCEIEKNLIECFYERIKGTGKYNKQCKSCDNEAKKIWNEKNKDQISKRRKKYREENKDKVKKQRKIYRENNKEEIKKSKREWYYKNKEEILSKQKIWRDENKEAISERWGKRYYGGINVRQKEYKKIYHKENKDKISTYNKKYNITHKEKVREIRDRRRNREQNIKGYYPKKHIKITYEEFNNECFNCKSIKKLCVDHHRALSKGYALSLNNAVILCGSCNSSKGPKDPEEFYGKEKCMELDERLKKVAENNQMTNYNNLSNEQLIKIVENLERQKKYGLVYKEHKEDIIKKCASHIPVFEEIRDRAVVGDGINHVLIEGDNYPSLLTLQGIYKNKVNVIYIDPPYNTGNKDFIYNDDLVDKEDMYRHSKWLSFMEPRLELARELLSDDGVIFISIDDNEQAQLKLLCDEVFGESNFICNFIWEKTQHFGRQKINSYSNFEYILAYAKKIHNGDKLKELFVEFVKKEHEDAPLYNASNKTNYLYFPPGKVKFNIKDGKYIKSKDDKYILNSPVIVKNGVNSNQLNITFKSRWSQKTINDQVDFGTVFWVKSENFAIRAIYGEGKVSFESPKSIIFTNKNNPMATSSFLGEKVGTTDEGSEELKQIIENSSFNYPKPKTLIKYLISIYFDYTNKINDKNSIILDFFAGSGTTFQAVAELNKEDGGQRKCILITNNENKICENITYQRCKKVIEGYTTPKGKIVEGTKQNLRYFRTNFIEAGQDQAQIRANLKANIAPMICMENDGYNLLKKDIGYEVYTNDDLTIAILISNTPKYIKSLKNILKDIKGPIKVYQALSTGGVETDLKQQLQNKNIEVYSSVDDYVKIYQHSTYKLRLEQNDE